MLQKDHSRVARDQIRRRNRPDEEIVLDRIRRDPSNDPSHSGSQERGAGLRHRRLPVPNER